MPQLTRITRDPAVMGGKPCIRGMRVTVGTVVGLDQGTTAASKFLRGGRIDLNAVVTTGTVKAVGAASINGACTVYCTWVPLTTGASLVAA